MSAKKDKLSSKVGECHCNSTKEDAIQQKQRQQQELLVPKSKQKNGKIEANLITTVLL